MSNALVSLQKTCRAQCDYASARCGYLINTLKLKQTAGLLNIKGLNQINRRLAT